MISACLITKNEENNLARCLNSIIGKVDEIILVDTGSSDYTLEIANKYNCKVFHFDWNDDFSEVRNYSLDHAKSEFVFIIDADEELSAESDLRANIRNSDQNSIYLVNVLSKSVNENGKTINFNSKQARLFRNKPTVRFAGRVHEQILNNAVNSGLNVVNSDLKIIHYGYDINQDFLIRKYERNLDLISKELSQNPHNIYYLIHKASTLNALDRCEEALVILLKLVVIPNLGTLKIKVLNLIGEIYYKSNNLYRSEQFFQASIQSNQTQIYPYSKLSELAYKNSNFTKSLDYLHKIETIKSTFGNDLLNDFEISENDISFKIAKLNILLGNYEKAKNYLQSKPNLILSDKHLAVLYANTLYHTKKLEQCCMVLENMIYRGDASEFIRSSYLKVKNLIDNSENPLISLCMIVKNEEKFLHDCIRSVVGLVDEIILVDTGSVDNTIKIAKEFGARIHQFEWVNDFSKARNESIKYARGKWILYLDADERLSDINHCKLRNYLESLNATTAGIDCIIESEVTKTNGEKEIQRGTYTRIFRNYIYPFVRFEGKVHEQVLNSLIEMGGQIIDSDIKIIHLGYNQDSETLKQKSDRNINLLKEQIKSNPEDAYSIFQFANTLLYQYKTSEAEESFLKAINLGNLSSVLQASAYNSLSQINGNRRNFITSLEYANMSLDLSSNQHLAYVLKAEAQNFLGLKKQALATIDTLLSIKNQIGFQSEIGFDIDYDLDSIHKFKNRIMLT